MRFISPLRLFRATADIFHIVYAAADMLDLIRLRYHADYALRRLPIRHSTARPAHNAKHSAARYDTLIAAHIVYACRRWR